MENVARNTREALQKTPLWQMHVDNGGKMTPFAGYDMSLHYEGAGVMKEHLHTRAAAGLFDVSHMGQAVLTGADPAAALETLVPGDIRGLAAGEMRYTVLLNDEGGIVDDIMVTRWDANTLFVVVNAACRDKDFAYVRARAGGAVRLEHLGDRALLAVQGPGAQDALSPLLPACAALPFMRGAHTRWEGRDAYISRSGYTGEDGFEVSLPAAQARDFAQRLLDGGGVMLAGLGARDSLRLEAGLCLYGQDLDETTTPVEANLKWTVARRRREERNFPGAEKIMRQMEHGPPRLRVGIVPDGRAPLRAGTELFSGGEAAGAVTSGGFGPSFGGPVAMGYVRAALAKKGAKLDAMLRGTPRPCAVAGMPFVQHNYRKD